MHGLASQAEKVTGCCRCQQLFHVPLQSSCNCKGQLLLCPKSTQPGSQQVKKGLELPYLIYCWCAWLWADGCVNRSDYRPLQSDNSTAGDLPDQLTNGLCCLLPRWHQEPHRSPLQASH